MAASSMLMASLFAVALIAYSVGIYVTERPNQPDAIPAPRRISAVGRTIAWAALSPVAAR